jgi:hypothetical protein
MPSLEEPIIFLKPPSSFLPNRGGPIRLPKDCDVHHEGTGSILPPHTLSIRIVALSPAKP